MGKSTGFIEFDRELPGKKPVEERRRNYNEFIGRYSDEKLNQQSARCMDCGVPFAIMVVHWEILFPSSMMQCIVKTGRKRMIY